MAHLLSSSVKTLLRKVSINELQSNNNCNNRSLIGVDNRFWNNDTCAGIGFHCGACL